MYVLIYACTYDYVPDKNHEPEVTMKKIYLALTCTGLLLSGCAGMSNASNGALMGGLLGALAGQALGHDTKSTLIGTGVGAAVGYGVGNEIDKNRNPYRSP